MTEKLLLRFFLDAGSGTCLWAGNELARQQFGYPVKLEFLSLSPDLIERGQQIVEDYDKSINWDNPAGQTTWDAEKCQAFNQRVEEFVTDLQRQLEENFKISNEFRPVTKYASGIAARKAQVKSMDRSDFEQIARDLNINLPQDYKEILGNYPQAAYSVMKIYLSNQRDWIIKQNKMIRETKNPSCTRKDWNLDNLVIGEDGDGNRYYIDLRQFPSPVYLFEREHPEKEQQVASGLVEWISFITEKRHSLLRSLPEEETRCPRCQLLGGSKTISRRQTGRKILEETQYTTSFRDGEFASCKCQFCGHRWQEDRSRTYMDVDWPRDW
ncbi:MAG TPA: SMI1/KNR4 family protein [Anaerolineales bacterium]|nr:SMI1/KNR4 family protein [Anaerolineales bacterium]